MPIHAKPGLNGNSAADFQSRGRKLVEAADNALIQLRAARAEIMHGRNYQHYEADVAREARDNDLRCFEQIESALEALQNRGIDIFDAGR